MTKSLGTSGSATRRVFSYKVGGTLEEIWGDVDHAIQLAWKTENEKMMEVYT